MSVKSDLIAAKSLIDTPDKWGRGMDSFENGYCAAKGNDPIGPLCAAGACSAVNMLRMWEQPNYQELLQQLHRALPVAVAAGVADFNDLPTTTHADVMALFDRAIKAAS